MSYNIYSNVTRIPIDRYDSNVLSCFPSSLFYRSIGEKRSRLRRAERVLDGSSIKKGPDCAEFAFFCLGIIRRVRTYNIIYTETTNGTEKRYRVLNFLFSNFFFLPRI